MGNRGFFPIYSYQLFLKEKLGKGKNVSYHYNQGLYKNSVIINLLYLAPWKETSNQFFLFILFKIINFKILFNLAKNY